MANSRKSWLSRHRFACAVGLAVAVHAAFLSFVPRAGPTSAVAAAAMLELELDLVLDEAGPPGRDGADAERRTSAVATQNAKLPASGEGSPFPRGSPPLPTVAAAEAPELAPAAEDPAGASEMSVGTAAASPARGERKPVRLFLSPKDLAELSRRQDPQKTPRDEQSAGRLTEEGEARDASQGLSRSSVAVSACYRSAELAPHTGTAVLEVRTDAGGTVTSVNVLGDDVTDAWFLVADDLLRQLKGRRLRVPAGAHGLITRLRIDRGQLAEALSERGHVKRGVAIGQDHHPKDYSWDESTQASVGGHRPAPSLGLSSESLRKRVKTRVSLLSQQVF